MKTRSDCNGNRMLHLEEFLENLFRHLRATISENGISIILCTYTCKQLNFIFPTVPISLSEIYMHKEKNILKKLNLSERFLHDYLNQSIVPFNIYSQAAL